MPPSLYRGACQSWQRQRGVQTVPWLIFLDLDLRATKFEIYNHWWKRQANIFNLFGKCYIPHHPINGLDRASYAYLGLPHYLKLLGWYILSYIIFLCNWHAYIWFARRGFRSFQFATRSLQKMFVIIESILTMTLFFSPRMSNSTLFLRTTVMIPNIPYGLFLYEWLAFIFSCSE